jgi:hypothetical protein
LSSAWVFGCAGTRHSAEEAEWRGAAASIRLQIRLPRYPNLPAARAWLHEEFSVEHARHWRWLQRLTLRCLSSETVRETGPESAHEIWPESARAIGVPLSASLSPAASCTTPNRGHAGPAQRRMCGSCWCQSHRHTRCRNRQARREARAHGPQASQPAQHSVRSTRHSCP